MAIQRFNQGMRRYATRSNVRRAGQVLSVAKRAWDGYKRATNKKPRAAYQRSAITSFQQDVSNVYNRRRAPRRVRAGHKRAQKQFNYKFMKTLGQRTYNVSTADTMTVTAASALSAGQAIRSIVMYGGETGAINGYGDLFAIANGVSTGISVDSKLLFKSAVLDMQIRNDAASVACVEVYEFVYRKDCIIKADLWWIDAMANQTALYGGSKALATLVGATPFDAPGFGTNCLITKVTRSRIAPGNSIYLQKRDPKNWLFDTSRFQATSGTAKLEEFKGMTKGYIIVGRSADVEASDPPTIGSLNLMVYSQRSYHWCQMDDAQDNQGFLIE